MEDWREAEFAKIDVAMDEMRDADPLDAEREAEFKAELAAFDVEHPGVCRHCGGSGTVTYQECLHDYFIDDVSDACPECLGEGRCPYCGEAFGDVNDSLDGARCTHCGWTETEAGSPAYPIRPEYDPGY